MSLLIMLFCIIAAPLCHKSGFHGMAEALMVSVGLSAIAYAIESQMINFNKKMDQVIAALVMIMATENIQNNTEENNE